jgi:hypothetical protein
MKLKLIVTKTPRHVAPRPVEDPWPEWAHRLHELVFRNAGAVALGLVAVFLLIMVRFF